MERRGYNGPLLKASIITTVTLIFIGIVVLINASSIAEPTGTVLTQKFIEAYSYKRAYQAIGEACLISILFTIGCAVLALLWNYSNNSQARKLLVVFIMLIAPVMLLGSIAPKNIDILLHKPHVEAVRVVGRTKRSGRRHTSYKFIFSNGKKGKVSNAEYYNVPDGTDYYVIICGDECTGAFNTDGYSLK